MKAQIKRFSPHQTAKVFACLMGIGVLPFFALFAVVFSYGPPPVDPQGNPVKFPTALVIVAPLFYMIVAYVSVGIGCWLYNLVYPLVGGIEIEYETE